MDSDLNGDVSTIEWKDYHLKNVDTDGNGKISRIEWNEHFLNGSDMNGAQWRRIRYRHLNIDRRNEVSLNEWKIFHSIIPEFYGGFDENGYIQRDLEDYYEREFRRVDCNYDLRMDEYEYNELGWNLRWCTSPRRPDRPWWR